MTPEQSKNIKTGLGILGGLALLYLIIGKKTDNSGAAIDPTGNGGYLPNPVFNAKNVASSLYEAMKDSGTDEETILEVLKTVNQAQFAQVVTAFGRLSYNKTLGNQYNVNPLEALPKVDLKGWLYNELSTKDYAILRSKYPSIL